MNNLNKLPPEVRALQMLFKEVLQRIPPETAQKLMDGYRDGKNIVVILGVK